MKNHYSGFDFENYFDTIGGKILLVSKEYIMPLEKAK